MENFIKNYPLIQRLVPKHVVLGDLDQKKHTQAVVNLLIKAGRVAKAAGHGNPTNMPFSVARPNEMIVEIESLLDDVLTLIQSAEILISQNYHK